MKRAVALVVLGACSSTLETPPDADPTDAETVQICAVPPVYGAAIATQQHAEQQDDYLGLVGALADTETFRLLPDAVSLEIYDPAIAPGVFTVGDQYRTCDVCLLLYADYVDGAPGGYYLATAGTVTLTDVTGRLVGSIADATFVEVDLGADLTSTPVADGCAASMTSLTFDAVIAL